MPGLVATSIAKALEIDEEAGRAVEETLAESVADLDRLVVIDNFEHLLGAAELVGRLLRSGVGASRARHESSAAAFVGRA